MDDVTTLDVWEARPANQAPRWLPSEPSKKGHSPTRRNALRGLQSLLTIRQRAEFDRRPNARKVLDTLVVGRPDQERLDDPCPADGGLNLGVDVDVVRDRATAS